MRGAFSGFSPEYYRERTAVCPTVVRFCYLMKCNDHLLYEECKESEQEH